MFDLSADQKERSRLAREHWRLLVGASTLQAVGALVSLLVVQPFASGFLTLWIGAALASVPGALVGLAWQLASERRRATSWPLVGLLPASAALLGGVASTFDVAAFDTESVPF